MAHVHRTPDRQGEENATNALDLAVKQSQRGCCHVAVVHCREAAKVTKDIVWTSH